MANVATTSRPPHGEQLAPRWVFFGGTVTITPTATATTTQASITVPVSRNGIATDDASGTGDDAIRHHERGIRAFGRAGKLLLAFTCPAPRRYRSASRKLYGQLMELCCPRLVPAIVATDPIVASCGQRRRGRWSGSWRTYHELRSGSAACHIATDANGYAGCMVTQRVTDPYSGVQRCMCGSRTTRARRT